MCFTKDPKISRSYEQGARIEIMRWLVALRKGCGATIDNATSSSLFLDTLWADGVPQRCNFVVVIRDNGTILMSVDRGATWIILFDPAATGGTQPSTIAWWSASVGAMPSDWLIADGQAVSRATYAALFAIISTTYGVGDGSTTFNLPDMRAINPMGVNDGTLPSGADGALTTRALASGAGAETHTLVEAELAAHAHDNSRGGTRTINAGANAVSGVAVGVNDTGSVGGDVAHNNLQVSLTLYPIIKT